MGLEVLKGLGWSCDCKAGDLVIVGEGNEGTCEDERGWGRIMELVTI